MNLKPHEVTRWAGLQGVKQFDEHDLEVLAGTGTLGRARPLVDTIEDLYEDEWSLCGTVRDGSERYLAMVHHAGGPLSSECDCPQGGPGRWCQHSVAVGLSYLGEA